MRVLASTRWLGCLVVMLLAAAPACKKSDPPPPDESVARLRACTAALTEARTLRGRAAVQALAAGCPYACSGLELWASAGAGGDATPALLDGCALACSPKARAGFEGAPPGEGYARLVAACGPDYYGLPEDAPLLSDTWFVLERINRWLAELRANANLDAASRAALDQAAAAAHFPLPLPAAHDLYQLPASSVAAPPRAAFYVVVSADQVRAAAVPIARLRGPRLELRLVPGGTFPGQPLPADNRAAAYRALVDLLAEHHPDDGDRLGQEPLVLADRALPFTRVLATARALGTARVRLGAVGHGAYAHPVALEPREAQSPAPRVVIVGDEVVVPSERGELRVPLADADRLRKEVSHFVVMRAPLTKVVIRIEESTSTQQAVQLLDAFHGAKLEAALFYADGTTAP